MRMSDDMRMYVGHSLGGNMKDGILQHSARFRNEAATSSVRARNGRKGNVGKWTNRILNVGSIYMGVRGKPGVTTASGPALE